MQDTPDTLITARHSGFRVVRHHYRPLCLLLVALLGLGGMLEDVTAWGPFGGLQRGVTAYLDGSEKQAVEAFAIARAINASVSVLKSADLSAVVAQVAPMEVLEPVDDLAKQFSDVMLVSIVSILVQRLVLTVSQAWALNVVLPAGCVLLALTTTTTSTTWAGGARRRLAAIGRGVVMLALFARFVVPAAGLVGSNVTDHFLARDLGASLGAMQDSGGTLNHITSSVAPATLARPADASPPAGQPGPMPQGVFDQFRNVMKSTASRTQAVLDRGTALMNAATAWVPDKSAVEALVAGLPGHIVTAIEVFVVQTVLMPLSVALCLYALLRGLLRPMPGRA